MNASTLIHNILQQLSYDPQQPMIFSSAVFLFLFLAFSLVYALLGKWQTVRLAFVTLFSYYFYYKSSGFYFVLLAVVTLSDFCLAHFIHKLHLAEDRGEAEVTAFGRRLSIKAAAKALLVLSLVIDLSFLGYFKYANFFGTTIAAIVGGNFQPWDIFLPVGISFFTFQSLSYTIDVYRRDLQPLRNPLDYAFYVSFFPQLVAGPIVRARDFIPQIRQPLTITRQMFGEGLFLIMGGLFKKAVISDYISINFVERIFDAPTLYTGFENLMGIYGYTLQIYCDFSGYSDMAIGIALLLGFRFPQNFNTPYISDSITDFWRRWHISLSSWLRDYLYISLGGNRCSRPRMYFNLFMTMLLGGLWHGASLNFIFWGGLHGVALGIHKWTRQLRDIPRGHHDVGIRRILSILATFHFVAFCWIFFRASTFEAAWAMIKQVVTNFHPEIASQFAGGYPGVFTLMLVGYIMHFLPASWQMSAQRYVTRTPLFGQALMLLLVIYIVVQVKSSDIQPFIYFQF